MKKPLFTPSRLIILTVLLLGTAPAFADGPPTPGPSPDAVPLDGGASLLVAAGVGLGIRKLRRRRQASE